jgi:hypothetical protein
VVYVWESYWVRGIIFFICLSCLHLCFHEKYQHKLSAKKLNSYTVGWMNVKTQSLPYFFSPTCPKAKFRQKLYLFFNNFHLSESSFTCAGFRTSGLARRLQTLITIFDTLTHQYPLGVKYNVCRDNYIYTCLNQTLNKMKSFILYTEL